MSIKDQQFQDAVDAIVNNLDLSDNQKRVEAGKVLRQTVERLKDEGKTVEEIAVLTGVRESLVHAIVVQLYEAHEQSIIWFPGIYRGREGDYAKKVGDISLPELMALVEKRAQEDGEWAIENKVVGENEANMRKMMEFVSTGINITQCVGHIRRNGTENETTVDWVCRELANASKFVHGSRG